MDQSDGSRRTVEGNALDAVRSLLAPHAADPVAGLPPFQGGAAGYLAYDWGAFSSGCQRRALTTSAWTMWCLACGDWVLAWDHEQSQAWLISTGVPGRQRQPGRGEPKSALPSFASALRC